MCTGKLAGIGGAPVDWEEKMKAVDPNLPRGLQFGLTWVHRISLYQAFDVCLLCNVGILRRWDIGQACVFYCSSAGGYISGVERLPASVPRAGFVVDLVNVCNFRRYHGR